MNLSVGYSVNTVKFHIYLEYYRKVHIKSRFTFIKVGESAQYMKNSQIFNFCTIARIDYILLVMKLYETQFLIEKTGFTQFGAVWMTTGGTFLTNSVILVFDFLEICMEFTPSCHPNSSKLSKTSFFCQKLGIVQFHNEQDRINPSYRTKFKYL